jgi:hypothetical protein
MDQDQLRTTAGATAHDTSENKIGNVGQDRAAGLFGSNIGANMLASAVAELIGTFILIYGGTAVAVAALLGHPVAGPIYTTRLPPYWLSASPCLS